MTFKLEQPPVLQSGNQSERNILSRWLYKLWLNKEEIQNSLSADFLLRNGSKSLTGNWDAGSYKITAETFTSDIADGTAPFTVTSTTLVSNLNAEHWNSKHLGSVSDGKLVRYNSTGTQLETGTVAEASGALSAITTLGMAGTLTDTLPAASQVYIDATTTPTTNTNGAVYVNATTATDQVEAVLVSLHDTSTTGGNTVRGISVSCWSDAAVSADSPNYYGMYSSCTVAGALSSAGSIEAIGVFGNGSITSSSDSGVRYSYGVYGTATGDANGVSTAYGVYGVATGADTNWAGYFAGNLYCNGAVSGLTTLSMGGQLTSTLATGTSPFNVLSTTLNTNLNADLLDGQHGAYYASAAGFLALDQTTPQTIINGVPLMSTAVDTDGDGTQLVNKNYVDLAVSSLNLTEFFHDEADALGGLYKVMDTTVDTVGTVVSATLSSTPENIFNFITPVGHPHLDRLPRGVYDCHAHLLKTNATGNRVITCYFELYKCDSVGGTQVLLGTSANSSSIGNTDTFYDAYLTIDTEIALAITDRLIIKWYATTVSGTGNTTVTMTTGGTVDPHFTIKIDALELDQIFVPYSGATHDIDLGTKTLNSGNIQPSTDNTYYLGENSGSFKAYKGIVLIDQTTGKHYRLEIDSGAFQTTLLD